MALFGCVHRLRGGLAALAWRTGAVLKLFPSLAAFIDGNTTEKIGVPLFDSLIAAFSLAPGKSIHWQWNNGNWTLGQRGYIRENIKKNLPICGDGRRWARARNGREFKWEI